MVHIIPTLHNNCVLNPTQSRHRHLLERHELRRTTKLMGSTNMTGCTLHEAEEEDGGYLHKAKKLKKTKLQSVKIKKGCITVTCWQVAVGMSHVSLSQSDSVAASGACSSSELVNTVVLHINLIYISELLWLLTSSPQLLSIPPCLFFLLCHI